jgi:hypothetical protein
MEGSVQSDTSQSPHFTCAHAYTYQQPHSGPHLIRSTMHCRLVAFCSGARHDAAHTQLTQHFIGQRIQPPSLTTITAASQVHYARCEGSNNRTKQALYVVQRNDVQCGEDRSKVKVVLYFEIVWYCKFALACGCRI